MKISSFVKFFSIWKARMISLILRSRVFSGVRKSSRVSCMVRVEKPCPRRPERRLARAAPGMRQGLIPMCFQKSSSSTATMALRRTGGMSRNSTTTRFSIANSPRTLPSEAKTCVMMFGWKSSSDVTWGRSLSKAKKTPISAPARMAATKSAVTTTRRRVRVRGAGGARRGEPSPPSQGGRHWGRL